MNRNRSAVGNEKSFPAAFCFPGKRYIPATFRKEKGSVRVMVIKKSEFL